MSRPASGTDNASVAEVARGDDAAPVLPYAGDGARRRVPPLWWRLGFTLACIYLPYGWLVTMEYPFNDYRLGWIRVWPIRPGLIAGLIGHPHDSNATLYALMGAMTAVGVGLFLFLAARSRRWVPVPTVLALGLSAWNSWVAYAIYRA